LSTELDTRARTCHDWWNRSTGQGVRLTMPILTAWIDLLQLGYTGQDIRRVLVYLRNEIANKKRQHGALALRNFLLLENFEKDLALANMLKSGTLDPEKKIPLLTPPTPTSSPPLPTTKNQEPTTKNQEPRTKNPPPSPLSTWLKNNPRY
jgi:hypothetical protein